MYKIVEIVDIVEISEIVEICDIVGISDTVETQLEADLSTPWLRDK